MTTVTSWKPEEARKLFAKLTKVANDMLDVASAAPEDAQGTAGPQEVVDAIDVIVDQLEEVQAAIPAEPSAEEGPVEEAPVDEPVAEEPVPEEEPKLAKKVRELTAQLEKVELEKVAKSYGELFEEPKVMQAKYEEVLASGKDSKYWIAKIEAISEFKENAGDNNSYKPAKTVSSWIAPRTKIAKQSNELWRL
jgi:hypothetical protein